MFFRLKWVLNYILENEEHLNSAIEHREGIDFAERYVDGAIRYKDEIIHYETIRERQFRKVYNKFIKISGWKYGHNVLDYGCGKGYMLYLLDKQKSFDYVAGLEILPELCVIAKHNIDKLNIAADIINADAREYKEIDSFDLFFMFNPFPEKAMSEVAKRIKESLDRKNRKIYIIYINSICEKTLLNAIPSLRKECTIKNLPRYGCQSSIYSNELS